MIDQFPSASTVAGQLECSRAACVSVEACWTSGGCALRYRPHSKHGARIRDSGAIRRKLRKDRECRLDDCGSPASDGHHILFRSHGGDDVEENIVGICHLHHEYLHHGVGEDYINTRWELGDVIADDEIQYVLRKLGRIEGGDFLTRAYMVDPWRIHQVGVVMADRQTQPATRRAT